MKLIGLARGNEVTAVGSVGAIRPHCDAYCVAKVTVDVDGREITCQATGVTETSALKSVAEWLLQTFGAKAAAVSEPVRGDLRMAA